jgi:hypothetical protein
MSSPHASWISGVRYIRGGGVGYVRLAIVGGLLLGGVAALPVVAQQVPDTAFVPQVERPQYPAGRGPRVQIDAAHLNFHTAEGGYAAFASLLRLDGYQVTSSREPFTAQSLAGADVLVIANAMHAQSKDDWAPLPTQSAFTESEIVEVEKWVRGGGSLLLIADHMPLAGHAASLASAFGVRFLNGFAVDAAGNGTITFTRSAGSLRASVIANGRNVSERVDAVTVFGGQAFRVDPKVDVEPLLVLPDGYQLLLPEVAFKFSESTPRIPAAHLLQGAIVRHGRGRVAFFGEAAMFSAQVTGPNKRPMGMNAPAARENARFALNLMHWLTRSEVK